MQAEPINRAEKIEESREIIAEVEETIEIPLSDARRALQVAGQNITFDSLYVEKVVQALGEAAGYAIETGHDDLASAALGKATELEQVISGDE